MILKSDLAKKLGVSRKFLFHKVHNHHELMRQLKANGYLSGQKYLYGRNLQLILEYFGTPKDMEDFNISNTTI